MIILPKPPPGDVPGVIFRQARHYRIGRRGMGVLWVVIHSAECGETNGAAEGLMAYAATMEDGRVASWTYAVDSDSVTQSVREADTAFHAPPINDCSIGIECAGKAAQTAEQWNDAYSQALITWKLVPLVADICQRHGIPPKLVDDDRLRGGLESAKLYAMRNADTEEWQGLRSLNGGIVTHAQVSRVFKVKSGHTDPGKGFPFDDFLRRVESRMRGAA